MSRVNLSWQKKTKVLIRQHLNSLHTGQFFMLILSSADFFQNYLFGKILSEIPSECQTVWTLIRPDDSSGLIWVQPVCQGYQQTTLVDKESIGPFRQTMKGLNFLLLFYFDFLYERQKQNFAFRFGNTCM